jgi:hypothetical protein
MTTPSLLQLRADRVVAQTERLVRRLNRLLDLMTKARTRRDEAARLEKWREYLFHSNRLERLCRILEAICDKLRQLGLDSIPSN